MTEVHKKYVMKSLFVLSIISQNNTKYYYIFMVFLNQSLGILLGNILE
jgi:hypothetical protein